MKDSLDYTMYMSLAKWLSGRLEPHVKGSVGHERLRGYSPTAPTPETAQEPVFCPADMQLDETSQKLLWNEFFRQARRPDGG